MTERNADEMEGSLARSVWERRSAILATAFVFAAGAFLALLLIGSRHEASVVLTFEDRGERGSMRAAVLAQAHSPAFASDVAARLPGPVDAAGLRAFSQRIVGIVEGGSRAVGGDAISHRSDISVSPGSRPGQYRVSASAASPDEAQSMAAAAAAELAERIDASRRRGTGAAKAALLDEARRAVAALQDELDAQPEDRSLDDIYARRRFLQESRDEVSAGLRLNDERGAVLSELARDPAGPVDIQLVPDVELRAALASYRALSASVQSLSQTLPEGSPRSRIGRLRLAQLRAEFAPELGSATVQNRMERDALSLRMNSLDDEFEALDRELAVAELRREARASSERTLTVAQERYQTLAAADRADELGRIVTTPQPAQRVPPPFGLATALAAIVGLTVGTLGSTASAFVARRRHSRSPSKDPSQTFDEGPADEPPAGDIERAGEPTPGAAGDALALRHDSISMEEAVSAVLSSRISRTLVVACEDFGPRSSSLRLARALADSGRLVLLVDLSPAQSAVREAGVPADTMGLSEVTAQMLGLSSVTVADEKSSLDLVTSGTMHREPAGRGRAEALGYAARAYDHVLVDCGRMPASEIAVLADKASAILLDAPDQPSPAVAERLRELDAAGLDTALLTP